MNSSSTPSIPTLDSLTVNAQSICQKSDPTWARVIMAHSINGKKIANLQLL